MKITIWILLLVGLVSCHKSETATPKLETLGRWHLIETFSGTGGAGGEYKPVISDWTLDFVTDTTLISTGSLCTPYTNETLTIATYSLIDSIIRPNCLSQSINKIRFRHQDSILILSFPSRCGMGMMYKYEKIQ